MRRSRRVSPNGQQSNARDYDSSYSTTNESRSRPRSLSRNNRVSPARTILEDYESDDDPFADITSGNGPPMKSLEFDMTSLKSVDQKRGRDWGVIRGRRPRLERMTSWVHDDTKLASHVMKLFREKISRL